MKALVKKSFDYSPDGISTRRLEEGETHDIADGVLAGLVEAGLIEPEADKKKNEKPAQPTPASGAPKPTPVAPRAPISPSPKA
jgi:hypothetical protein